MDRKQRNARIANERMQQIRTAAQKIFAANGFDKATTDDIAREAGVSPGLVFHYFGSKKHLLIDVVSSLAIGSLSRFLGEADAGETIDALLVRFLRGHGEFMFVNLDLLNLVLYEARFHDQVRLLIAQRLIPQATDVLADFFRRQVAAGILRADLDVALTARAFVGLLASFVVLKGIVKEPALGEAQDEAAYRQIVRLFLDGARPRPQSP